MIKKVKHISFYITCLLLVFTGCYYDIQEELHPSMQLSCDTTQATYSGRISAIMATHCNGCHSGGSASGGIRTDIHSELSAVAATGRLTGAVNHEPGFRAMPQNAPKLNSCDLTLINKWVSDGRLNN